MVPGAIAYPNFRVVGGQRTTDGRRVLSGLVYRSEALLSPAGNDAAILVDLGIRLVCDLRSGQERDRAPNTWWQGQAVEHLHLDLLSSLEPGAIPWPRLRQTPTAQGAHEAMIALYAALPVAAVAPVSPLLRRLAKGELPVLIHCTAGKDRTGFVIALLLALLGVPRGEILADYLQSTGRWTSTVLAATRAMVRTYAGDLPDPAVEALMSVDEAYLDASFVTIDDRFGGIESYLAAIGITASEQAALRTVLLV